MNIPFNFSNLGLSPYALKVYLALVQTEKPINGSQLSVKADIPRARVYDVLRSLKSKGIAVELEPGLYAPLPPEELVKRFRQRFDMNIKTFEQMLEVKNLKTHYEYVWTIDSYDEIITKANEMIAGSKFEVYIRVMPEEGRLLEENLVQAEDRGVAIKFIVLGEMPQRFEFQMEHHNVDMIYETFGGRSVDIVVDKEQILAGILDKRKKSNCQLNWTKNRSFVISGRENIRQDYYHILLYKLLNLKQPLSQEEKKIYEVIETDY